MEKSLRSFELLWLPQVHCAQSSALCSGTVFTRNSTSQRFFSRLRDKKKLRGRPGFQAKSHVHVSRYMYVSGFLAISASVWFQCVIPLVTQLSNILTIKACLLQVTNTLSTAIAHGIKSSKLATTQVGVLAHQQTRGVLFQF